MKKGQSANETAMIIGVMVLFMIGFLAVLGDKLIAVSGEKNREIADDLAETIESELFLAANAQDGYYRIFSIPEALDGLQYQVMFYNKTYAPEGSSSSANFSMIEITVNVSGVEYTSFKILPDNIFGVISKGNNIVRKQAGIVNLTQG